jgi:hypothetical protein
MIRDRIINYLKKVKEYKTATQIGNSMKVKAEPLHIELDMMVEEKILLKCKNGRRYVYQLPEHTRKGVKK